MVMADEQRSWFGDRLAVLMERAGIESKKEFAEKVGISHMTLNRYEREEREPPASTIIAMAKLLKCTTDELLGLPRDPRLVMPAGVPVDDLVQCLLPVARAAEEVDADLNNWIFPSGAFLDLVDALQESPFRHRIELLKGFALEAGTTRNLPHAAFVASVPNLSMQELSRHVAARHETMMLVAQIRAVFLAVLHASMPKLSDPDDLFESPMDELQEQYQALDALGHQLGEETEPLRTVRKKP
jgi:transcriptional regulator with XRE-family HTH domain